MSEVYSSVLQSLMSSISSTQKLIEQAKDLKHFKNATRTLKTLQSTIEQLEYFLETSKPTRKFGKQSKPTKYLINSIRSAYYAIENREISLADFCTELRTDVFDRLQDLIEASRTHLEKMEKDPELMLEDFDPVSKNEDSEDLEDFSQAQYEYVNNKLSVYTKLVNRSLVSKIKSDKEERTRNAVVPVELPITVSFENAALRSTKLLRHIFQNVEPLGLSGSDSSDVALILPKQTILQFGRTAAEEIAYEIVNSDAVAKNVDTYKQRLAKERSTLKKLIKDLDNENAQKSSRKILGTLTKEKEKQFNTKISELNRAIESQQEMIKTFADRFKDSKSLHRSRVKSMDRKTANVYYTRIADFLDKIREHGHEYSLMSFDFVTSPKNTDIALAWVVPTSVYKKLYSQTKGNVKVLSWGLPLSTKIGGSNVKNRKQITRSNKV